MFGWLVGMEKSKTSKILCLGSNNKIFFVVQKWLVCGEMMHSYYKKKKKRQTIQKSTRKKIFKKYPNTHHLEIQLTLEQRGGLWPLPSWKSTYNFWILLMFCEFHLELVTGKVRKMDGILPYMLFYLKVWNEIDFK